MITVASKLFVEESAQVDDRFMVKSKLLDALRVGKLQYIQMRSEYLQLSSLHSAISIISIIHFQFLPNTM